MMLVFDLPREGYTGQQLPLWCDGGELRVNANEVDKAIEKLETIIIALKQTQFSREVR